MRRIVACVVAALVMLLIAPAEAQLGNPGWGADFVEVRESDGEAVLTLSFGGTGQVKYRTFDGTCKKYPSEAPADTSRGPCDEEDQARATEDYTAVSGEVFFASPGSRTVRIPVVDDDLVEQKNEFFTVHAVEDPNPDPWPYGGSYVTVKIIDDDATGAAGEQAESAASRSQKATTRAAETNNRPTSTTAAAPIGAGSPTTSAAPTTTSAPPTLEVAIASDELRPGPGFELTGGETPRAAPERGGGGGGSTPWSAFGLGTAGIGAALVTMVRRRRRWSPARA